MKSINKLFLVSFFSLLLNIHLGYSQQPTQEWVARYQRPSGSSAIANQMALDKVGNCYVLGNRPVSGGIGGILTIKYNSSGDTVWTRTYNIGSGNAAVNTAIVADSIGNVYVIGYVGPTFGPYDLVFIKYNPAGVQQWIKTYPNASPGGIALDKQSRPYICGSTGGSVLVIKYNINGDTIWSRTFNIAGNGSGTGHIKINEQGFIYLGGNSRNTSTNQNHYLALKYDSNGVYQWHNIYTSTGFESMLSMAIDVFGNCYLTGIGSDGITDGGLTIKYNINGVLQWVKAFFYGEGGRANAIIADGNGNAYITGYYGVGGPNLDYITIKYNPNGDSVWVRTYGGTANGNDEAYSIDKDDSNNIYITGRSRDAVNNRDYVTIKYNSDGAQQWLARYNGPPGNADDIAFVLKLDNQRNVFVTGVSDRGGFIFDYATIKYSQLVGIEPIANETPNKYQLYQNYPNPFNPRTNIKYQIVNNNSDIKLAVYDITGREVVSLVNEEQNFGIYEIIFEPENLSSGIYFYKLITENYIETKKMLLIK